MKPTKEQLDEAQRRMFTIMETFDRMIDEMKDEVAFMPDKGDTSETSQKINIINAINYLDHTINGLCVEDFIKT